MAFPNQSPPVNRPQIFTLDWRKYTFIDPLDEKEKSFWQLVPGANPDPNRPMYFSEPDNCGCHIFSGSSMAMCLSACGSV
jgi:hypothetical protein